MTVPQQFEAGAFFDRLRDEALRLHRPPPADLHIHTTYTDGAQSVREMWDAAVASGMTTILYSEHSRATSQGWFENFSAEIRALPTSPCQALVGTEVKIADFDGTLDLNPEIGAQCDLVMASVHRFPGEQGVITGTTGGFSAEQAIDIEYRLSMAALDNPRTDILGHPFGMSIRRFKTAPPWTLIENLIAKCAATGKAFEINARYHTDIKRMLESCLVAGARISFGSNAHDVAEVGDLQRKWQEER